MGAYYSLALYVLVTSGIDYVLITSLHPENNRLPPKFAEFYLFNFRGDKDDLDVLKSLNGLSFILNDTSKPRDEAFKYVSFFLEKGFDINSVGFDGFTALHAAIIFNQPKDVAFLLERGADINVRVGYRRVYEKPEKNSFFGMNAIELAHHFSKKGNQDRSEIDKLLTVKI
jgi:ankyrin repeat protein